MFRSTDIKILSAIFADEQRTQVTVKYLQGGSELIENVLANQKKFQELVDVYGLDNIHEDTSNWIKEKHDANDKFIEAIAEQRGYVKKKDHEYLDLFQILFIRDDFSNELMFKLKIEALQAVQDLELVGERKRKINKLIRSSNEPRDIVVALLEATSPLP